MIIASEEKKLVVYKLELSEADARKAVDSPYLFADDLALELRAAGVAPSEAAHEKPARKTAAVTTRKTRASTKKVSSGPKSNGRGSKLLSCPQCPKTFKTQGYLNRHLAQVHGQTNGWAPAPSPAAAPAAGSSPT